MQCETLGTDIRQQPPFNKVPVIPFFSDDWYPKPEEKKLFFDYVKAKGSREPLFTTMERDTLLSTYWFTGDNRIRVILEDAYNVGTYGRTFDPVNDWLFTDPKQKSHFFYNTIMPKLIAEEQAGKTVFSTVPVTVQEIIRATDMPPDMVLPPSVIPEISVPGTAEGVKIFDKNTIVGIAVVGVLALLLLRK